MINPSCIAPVLITVTMKVSAPAPEVSISKVTERVEHCKHATNVSQF